MKPLPYLLAALLTLAHPALAHEEAECDPSQETCEPDGTQLRPNETREVYCTLAASIDSPETPTYEQCFRDSTLPLIKDVPEPSQTRAKIVLEQIRLRQRTADALPPIPEGKEDSVKEAICRAPVNYAPDPELTLEQERARALKDYQDCMNDPSISDDLADN